MIGIIAAMEKEMAGIEAVIENKKIETVSGIKFVSGTVYGKEVVCAVCGIGKVFAAICAEAMIIKYNPDVIINTGVAGTLTDKLSIADVAISTGLVQHDMDTSFLGDPVGLISGINVVEFKADDKTREIIKASVEEIGINYVEGVIASGDQFIADKSVKQRIIENFGAVACEMEGGSMAQVCYVNKVPFCAIRSISDTADGDPEMAYVDFLEIAAKNSIALTLKFIEKY
jgi:adenosylhomocysteine nucleosidase